MQQQGGGPREGKGPDQANFIVFLGFLPGLSLQDLWNQEGWGSVWPSQHLLTFRLRWKGQWGTCSLPSGLTVLPWSQGEAIADSSFLGPHLLSFDCGFNLWKQERAPVSTFPQPWVASLETILFPQGQLLLLTTDLSPRALVWKTGPRMGGAGIGKEQGHG
jgi:hypothetical protein